MFFFLFIRTSVYFSFRFGSSLVILISFLALSLQYYHECQYTPFKAVPNVETPVVSTLPPVVGINFGNSFASIAVFTKLKDAVAICLWWIDDL